MSEFPKTALWKAVDGREFIIDTIKENIHTEEELHEHIAKLRKQYGYSDPTFVHVAGDTSTFKNAIDINKLPENIQAQIINAIKEGYEQIDPDKLQ